MPLPTIPTKTPLGQEEMRRRTGGLGQRHRTILFLIDGRRTLAEVLGLAHQAGASTSHFEDLVRLGYVELPAEEPPAPPPLPEPAQPPAELQITHLEVLVPAPEPEIAAQPGTDTPPLPETAELPPPPLPAPPPVPMPVPMPVRAVAATRVVPAPPAPLDEDAPLLERARACLLETIRVDAQPAGTRIAERARQAQTTVEMIEVVWVVERGLSHSQRSHRGLLNLQKARELLGLGNTLVDEDTRPSRLDDDEW